MSPQKKPPCYCSSLGAFVLDCYEPNDIFSINIIACFVLFSMDGIIYNNLSRAVLNCRFGRADKFLDLGYDVSMYSKAEKNGPSSSSINITIHGVQWLENLVIHL